MGIMGQKVRQKQFRKDIMQEDKKNWRQLLNRIYLFFLTAFSWGTAVLFRLPQSGGAWILVLILIVAVFVCSQVIAWLDMDDMYKSRRILAACSAAVLWMILAAYCCYIIHIDTIDTSKTLFPSLLTCFKYFWKQSILAGILGGIFQYASGSLFACLMFLLLGASRPSADIFTSFFELYPRIQIMLAKTAVFVAVSDGFGYVYQGTGKLAAIFYQHRSIPLVVICFIIIRIIAVVEHEFFYQRDKWHKQIFWINAIEFMIGSYFCIQLYYSYFCLRLKAGYEVSVPLGSAALLTFFYYGISEIHDRRKKKKEEDLTYAIWHVRKFPEDKD